MFWLISEPQATLPDISEAFYLKPCLNSHLQTMQLENLHLWMLTGVFSKCRILFVWGFQGGFLFFMVFFLLCKQTQLWVHCVQNIAQSGNPRPDCSGGSTSFFPPEQSQKNCICLSQVVNWPVCAQLPLSKARLCGSRCRC